MKAVRLTSKQDLSINFVAPNGQESRYVRRTDDYMIVYLSSHNGCSQACRFCHLTQTGQTQFEVASVGDMLLQADRVLGHYREEVSAGRQSPVKTFHYNWMARGEPLLNPHILSDWNQITEELKRLSGQSGIGYQHKFNLSTIMPVGMSDLDFPSNLPTVYYSLYSVNPTFRKRWLPKALPVQQALARLKDYQSQGGQIVFHWAFIEGHNDDRGDVLRLADVIEQSGIKARFNLVRYNPYSIGQGQEPSEEVLQDRFEIISSVMKIPGSRIVPRVGFDVKASCGMFIDPNAKEPL